VERRLKYYTLTVIATLMFLAAILCIAAGNPKWWLYAILGFVSIRLARWVHWTLRMEVLIHKCFNMPTDRLAEAVKELYGIAVDESDPRLRKWYFTLRRTLWEALQIKMEIAELKKLREDILRQQGKREK
jgi:hypothetical protein